jgi:hypothetical protein
MTVRYGGPVCMIAALLPAGCFPCESPAVDQLTVAASRQTPARSPAGNDVVARFDATTRKSLPASLMLPEIDYGDGILKTLTLTVKARLRSSVTFPDEVPAMLFDAVLDGHAATVTRSGTDLDISVVMDDGVHVMTVRQDSATIGHTHLPAMSGEGPRRQRRSPGYGFEGDVEYLGTPPVPMPLADPLAPLEVRIFLHDEMRSSRTRDIHAGYVAWWLRDMESMVLPDDVSIDVIYQQAVPGISDRPYGAPNSLFTWLNAVDAFTASRHLRRTWKNKYLLITEKRPAPGKLGQAIPARGIAVATVSGPYSVVAHELGHLLGADHAEAEWRAAGQWWPCRTNMYPNDAPLLANCYEYSAGNVSRIRRYVDLKGYPGP